MENSITFSFIFSREKSMKIVSEKVEKMRKNENKNRNTCFNSSFSLSYLSQTQSTSCRKENETISNSLNIQHRNEYLNIC